MAEIALSEEQKGVVRRYVETWRRWRPGIRAFARLEEDLDKRCDVLVDGIAVDNRPGHPVITDDGKDSRFHAAIFGNDDAALPDVTADELAQVRRYILRGEGTLPVRKWREPKRSPGEISARHASTGSTAAGPAA
jgi:hypothetical protein